MTTDVSNNGDLQKTSTRKRFTTPSRSNRLTTSATSRSSSLLRSRTRSRSPSPAPYSGRSSKSSISSQRSGRSFWSGSVRRRLGEGYHTPSPPLSPTPRWQQTKWKKKNAWCGLGAFCIKRKKGSSKSRSPPSSPKRKTTPSSTPRKKKGFLSFFFSKKFRLFGKKRKGSLKRAHAMKSKSRKSK